MAQKKGNSFVYHYLEAIEKHLPYLHQIKKIDTPSRHAFFEQFLGCSKLTYLNWWSHGIKKIYHVILFLLNEIQEHRKRIEILEKQLNELTKK